MVTNLREDGRGQLKRKTLEGIVFTTLQKKDNGSGIVLFYIAH